MPGLEIGQDSLVVAGTIVTKSVANYSVVADNSAKPISDIEKIKNKVIGELVYIWRYHFSNYMPWKESGFSTWYNSLDMEEKKNHKIESLIESSNKGGLDE